MLGLNQVTASTVCLLLVGVAEMSSAQSPDVQQTRDTAFLEPAGKDGDWLDTTMKELGAAEGYRRDGDTVVLETRDARSAFNHVRAFAEASVGGLRTPYVRIVLARPEASELSCVTETAKALVPDLSPDDVVQPAIDIDRADPRELRSANCLPAREAEAATLPLEFKLAFDEDGMLKPDHGDLQDDQVFLHALWSAGFYMSSESYSGTLTIK